MKTVDPTNISMKPVERGIEYLSAIVCSFNKQKSPVMRNFPGFFFGIKSTGDAYGDLIIKIQLRPDRVTFGPPILKCQVS